MALAVNFFLLKNEEPVVPPAPVRIPIKEAPVMGNATGVKALKTEVEAKEKVVEKGKAAVKADKPEAKKKAIKAETKKEEPKPMVSKPSEAKVAKKEETKDKVRTEVKREADGKGGRVAVIIGTYAARFEVEEARAKLKGIPHTVEETKKKLMMNRILAKEVKDKDEAKDIVSKLKENGYDPFMVHKNGMYKVYAVSNLNETISNANKADLEKLGYLPVVEKKEARVKVYQLIAQSKSEADVKSLSGRLEKLGFKPEVVK